MFESTHDRPGRIRLTWDASDPTAMVWRNEASTGGGSWSLIEEYRCTPVARREPATPARRSRRGHSTFTDAVRRFNKRALNPLMLHLAGKQHWYAARLEHVGRRSGRTYATPVVALPVPGGFAVPLPYGHDVDWRRNLAAAGRGELTVHGTRYVITAPRTAPAAAVTGPLTPYRRRMLRGIAEYLVVSAEPATSTENGTGG